MLHSARTPRWLIDWPPSVGSLTPLIDALKLGELALAFHSTVVEAARSPRITVVLRAMSALVPGSFFVLVPRAVEPERKGLRAIVRAIRQGNGDRAAAEYARMLAQQAEYVVDLFHERQALSQAV